MAAKKAKGDDWFSSLDAELEKKTREIIENVGEQNVARLELNKTLIEDFWRVWKRFNKMNVDDLHRLFADLVRVWYESHLRRNRDVLIKYLKQTFEKVETFNQ